MLERKEIESIYSMSFYSFDLNDGKMDCVRRKADRILSFKNSLSNFIHKNFEACLEMSQSDMVVQFGQPLSGLTGQDVQNAICDVHTTYSNKFGQIQNKMRCEIQGEPKITRYKRNGKDFKQGDIRAYESTMRTTPLTKVASFLARYADVATKQWIELALEKDGLEKDKATFYRTVLYYMDKFGEARLLRLAFERREWVYRRYNRVPIEFKSLTFRSTSRTSQDILAHNANRKSVIKNFLNIGGFVIDDVIGEIQEPVFSLDKKDDLDAGDNTQQCFKCKAIDKNNRKTQEIFHCTTCHHECNADENSANNLAGRLKEDVLRETLHKKNAIGEWIPAKMSRDKIKGFLSSFCTHRNKDHEQDESIACASSNGGQE